MRKLYHFLMKTSALLDKISWGILFTMMVMTITDVLLRKFTSMTILGCDELTEMMLVVIVFCSLTQREVDDGHIRIDLIRKRLNLKLQVCLDALIQLASFGIVILVTLSSLKHGLELKTWHEVSNDLAIPTYPLVFISSLGLAMLTLVLLNRIIICFNEVYSLWIRSQREL